MGSFFGGLFSAISNIFGSNEQAQAQQQANQTNLQIANMNEAEQRAALAQNQADFEQSFAFAQQQNQQAQAQQAFNNQIAYGGNIASVMQNVVDAAKASGISPLAALGMQTPGASVVPGVSAPSGGAGMPSPVSADIRPASMGAGIQAMGQDVGRAIEGFYDATSRKAALAEEYTRAQITNLDAQSASLTMDAARKLGAPGSPKPNQDLNHFIFGKEPQWPVGIPGDLATGLLKGIDWGAGKLDSLGQWFEHLRVNEPDPSVYNTP